jgi:hypothetical protein
MTQAHQSGHGRAGPAERMNGALNVRAAGVPLALARPAVARPVERPERPDPAGEAARHAIVRRDAPAIYGGLLVTALIAVQWRSDAISERVSLSILISVFVFWLTHVWAELVDHRVSGPVSRDEVVRIAWAEAPMLAAAVPPAATLAIARLAGIPIEDAISLALVVSIAQLALWGLAIGRALNRGWGVALLTAAVECAFGMVLVGLKVVVVH